jgi:hypothetical protein
MSKEPSLLDLVAKVILKKVPLTVARSYLAWWMQALQQPVEGNFGRRIRNVGSWSFGMTS